MHLQPINVLRLLSIWGQHESLLRNLRLRFDAGLIKNFFTHFSEPWIYLIYHDMYRRELNAKNLHATLEHVDPYLNLIKETRYLIVLNGWERVSGGGIWHKYCVQYIRVWLVCS